jgi:hypothetical protein
MARSKSKVRSKGSILGKHRKAITKEQMDMLLRLGEQYNTSYDFEASQWFWSKLHQNEIPSTIEEFENKYPQGSREFQLFERFTSKFELAGLLIEYGLLSNMDSLTRISITTDTEDCKRNGSEPNRLSME